MIIVMITVRLVMMVAVKIMVIGARGQAQKGCGSKQDKAEGFHGASS
jgi:hypothetical protein